MTRVYEEISAIVLLDTTSECPSKILVKTESPDWITHEENCGIEVTMACKGEEMKAFSFFGGSFKEVKNIMALRGIGKEYTFFKDSNTYFKFNPDSGTITHYIDGKPSSIELLKDIHPDIICELDEFKLLGSNSANWEGKHDFEESIIKELKKKMDKLNSKKSFFKSFDSNILFVFSDLPVYNYETLREVCKKFKEVTEKGEKKFHVMYVFSFEEIFKFDLENEEVSIIEVDMESVKMKKDGIINSFLGYDHKDPIHKDNVKKDLRRAFKDGTVLTLE